MRSTPQPARNRAHRSHDRHPHDRRPILTSPGAPTFHRSFWRLRGAATHTASARRPAATQRTVGRANHPRFQCRSTGNSRWYTGSACRQARRTRLSAPLPCRPTSPPSGWTRHRSCVSPARPACLTSRTENSPRMREPGSASCSANAETSTTSCPRPRTDIPRHLSERPVPVYDGGPLCVLKCAPKRKCAHLRTQMGWFASLCARTRRFGAHLRTQWPTRGKRAGQFSMSDVTRQIRLRRSRTDPRRASG